MHPNHYSMAVNFPFRDCFISGRVRWENGQIHPHLPDRLEVYRMVADCGIPSSNLLFQPDRFRSLTKLAIPANGW